MKTKETVAQYLLRRLDELEGQHNTIAKESGVAQSTVSRIYLRESSPTLNTAQRLLDWIEAHDRKTLPSKQRRESAAAT